MSAFALRRAQILCSSRWLALVAALMVSACRGSITNPFADEARLTSIEVSGANTTVPVGDTTRLVAIGHVSGVIGLIGVDRLMDAVWTVSDASLVQLTPIPAAPNNDTSYAQALVRGAAPGTVLVTVSARGVSGSVPVHVTPAP